MTRHFLSAAFVIVLAFHSALTGQTHAETRTWTDTTGKFKIEADFLEIVEGQVKLQRPDGKKVSLPLLKLSKDDQAYLKEEMKRRRDGGAGDPDNPFQTEEDDGIGGAPDMGRDMTGPRSRSSQIRNAMRRHRDAFGGRGDDDAPQFNEGDEVEVKPFAADNWQRGVVVGFGEGPFVKAFIRLKDGSMVEADEDELRPYDPTIGALAGVSKDKLARVNLNGIRRIVPLGGSEGGFKPDPAPAGETAWNPKPVGLNPKADFHEHVAGLSFAKGGTTAAVAHQQRMGVQEDESRIEFCDLKSGRVTGVVRGPRKVQKIAISPDGKRLATISEAETFIDGPVQIWEVGGKELKHLNSWQVTGDDVHNGKIEWLGWLDDGRLMTIDRRGLTVWNFDGPSGEYQIMGDGMKAPSFSPGGKQFAVGTDNGMSIHDAASGELLTRIKMDHGFNRHVAFSPSGKLLAATGQSGVDVYDATTGEKVMDAYAGNSRWDLGICWLDEEHVLVGGQELIHLPSQMTVWTYNHHGETVVALAGRVWYVFSDVPSGSMALLPFKLPHSAVKPVTEKELALKPGDEVSVQLEVSFDMTGPNGETAEDQLKKSLTDAGFKVVDNSNKKLVGRATPGESKDIEYRMFGRGFGTEKASYQERVFELELLVDDQSVWKRRRVWNAPFHIQLEKDETVEQAIQRLQAADTGFFRSTVPSRLLPTEAEQARTSQLTINGME